MCPQLKTVIEKCKFFSLVLHESTDVSDICQLLIFIESTDADFFMYEKLLELIPHECSTAGALIYKALAFAVSKHGGFQKCSCTVIDVIDCHR